MRAVQIFSATAAGLGAVGVVHAGTGIEAWVAMISAVTSAIGAYALSQRYPRLAATYRLAADRLKLRLTTWNRDSGTPRFRSRQGADIGYRRDSERRE